MGLLDIDKKLDEMLSKNHLIEHGYKQGIWVNQNLIIEGAKDRYYKEIIDTRKWLGRLYERHIGNIIIDLKHKEKRFEAFDASSTYTNHVFGGDILSWTPIVTVEDLWLFETAIKQLVKEVYGRVWDY